VTDVKIFIDYALVDMYFITTIIMIIIIIIKEIRTLHNQIRYGVSPHSSLDIFFKIVSINLAIMTAISLLF
jgi:hypothetical protein